MGAANRPMSQDLLSPELLEILVCPVCKGELVLLATPPRGPGLHCPACHKIFPIRDGIPVMLEGEAIPDD